VILKTISIPFRITSSVDDRTFITKWDTCLKRFLVLNYNFAYWQKTQEKTKAPQICIAGLILN
jgi:hypothetical protein